MKSGSGQQLDEALSLKFMSKLSTSGSMRAWCTFIPNIRYSVNCHVHLNNESEQFNNVEIPVVKIKRLVRELILHGEKIIINTFLCSK